MIRALIFIIKYKILKDPTNLSYRTKEFFRLSKNTQRKVLDKYFDYIKNSFSIEDYFDTKESRFYDGDLDVTFFNCYYFDKLCLEHNINNIKLIDKFKLSDEKINFLINYALEIVEEDKLVIRSSDLVNYLDNIPTRLGRNTKFMKYLIDEDYSNVKYLVNNELCPNRIRELINGAIKKASEDDYCIDKFLKQDKSLPEILRNNFDFILYLISNDIENIKYLNSRFIDNLTISNKDNLIDTIILSLKDNDNCIEFIEENTDLAVILNRNEKFINYIIDVNVDNVKYVDWHNILDELKNRVIDNIVISLKSKNIEFDIMKYSFKNIFFINYNFMKYLIEKDFRWIAVSSVNSKSENDMLIDYFFERLKLKKYKFRLNDFLGDGKYLNNNLLENKRMFHYLFGKCLNIIKYINFFDLKNHRLIVENLAGELEKTGIDYKFNNNDFLIDGKYPVVLSNSYRFMRFVIDKDFNNIAYMNISMMDKREKIRIINYAFRMVYYIRGRNKNLNFDLNEEYFKRSMIINDDYFLECLKSL